MRSDRRVDSAELAALVARPEQQAHAARTVLDAQDLGFGEVQLSGSGKRVTHDRVHARHVARRGATTFIAHW
ncbi:hypothetical protein GCM10010196_16350 [Agromyces mediolanus]|uniref:Uncharacterized protein n=1 Tax=Agromyces mediolanus TaxID=41986 RepID=A0A918F9Z5_AGRME|nr:hypothetical protein GCM10010196_16350 [Agromyces mediolanus]GLJ71107.1 hypothetical protein GCM10017583_03620 [Agromyces mediolanus]